MVKKGGEKRRKEEKRGDGDYVKKCLRFTFNSFRRAQYLSNKRQIGGAENNKVFMNRYRRQEIEGEVG